MNKQELAEAFDFYAISDAEYQNVLENALRTINSDADYQRAFETGRAVLYTDNTDRLNSFWSLFRKKEDFFGREMPEFSTDLLLLSGKRRQEQNMQKYRLDEAQWAIQLKRMRDIFTHYGRRKNEIYPVTVIWGSLFINGKMLEVGRMQYEFYNMDGRMSTNMVHIHIPGEGKLTKEAVDASLREAVGLMKKTYGVSSLNIHCTTWFLSRQLEDCVQEGTNIAYFRSLFTVTDMGSCVDEVMGYLFHSPVGTPYADLPEDTSLQRKVKQYLLAGGDILKGDGALKA